MPDFAENLGIKWVYIPGGTFRMGVIFWVGHHNEHPVHKVNLSPYYLSATQVTRAQYEAWPTKRPKPIYGRAWLYDNDYANDLPVTNVSWNDAEQYCKWLSKKTGWSVRLPTEAEWEYAARSGGKWQKWAGTSRKRALGKYAWYEDNSRVDDLYNPEPHLVATKRPNRLGLYDMSGNVSEWCADWYYDYYPHGPFSRLRYRFDRALRRCILPYPEPTYLPDDPRPEGTKIIRGGDYWDSKEHVRCTDRGCAEPSMTEDDIGFRLARTP